VATKAKSEEQKRRKGLERRGRRFARQTELKDLIYERKIRKEANEGRKHQR
jgi:hypothetical protein